jgi:hypothetical protein
MSRIPRAGNYSFYLALLFLPIDLGNCPAERFPLFGYLPFNLGNGQGRLQGNFQFNKVGSHRFSKVGLANFN